MHLNALGLGKAWQYCQQHPITIPFWFWNVNLYQASYVRNNRYKSVAQLASGCHEGGQRGQAGPAGPRDQSRASQCRVAQVRRLRAPWQSWEGSAMARRGEGGLEEVGFPPTQPHLSRFWLAARRTASSCGVPAAPP